MSSYQAEMIWQFTQWDELEDNSANILIIPEVSECQLNHLNLSECPTSLGSYSSSNTRDGINLIWKITSVRGNYHQYTTVPVMLRHGAELYISDEIFLIFHFAWQSLTDS